MVRPRLVIFLATLIVFIPHLYAQERCGTNGISSLIGMRIPPSIPAKNPGHIPGWNGISAHALPSATSDPKLRLGLEEGHWSCDAGFLVDSLDDDLTRTVLDAKALPKSMRQYDVVNGKLLWHREAAERFRASPCELPNGKGVVGIMRPESGKSGCLHWSRRVVRAWQFNDVTKKLEVISVKNVRCYYGDAEDECAN